MPAKINRSGQYFKCGNCGKEIYEHPCKLVLLHHFCNRDCFIDFKKKNPGFAVKQKNGRNVSCKVCGKIFYKPEKGKQVFCSKECGIIGGRSRGRKRKGALLICSYCGKKYYKPKCWVGKSRYCSVQCRNVGAVKAIDKDFVIACYGKGLSAEDVGKNIGVCGAIVLRRLRKWGIAVRGRGDHMNTDRNPTKGKGHTEETKRKLRRITKKQFSNPEARALASHNQCLYLAKNLVSSVSGVEDRVAKELDRQRIAYQRQVPIRDPVTGMYGACVDFLIDGTAIEVNGTYWHSDPRVYPNGPQNKSQGRTARAYKKKTDLLSRIGIPVVEIWEADVDKNIVRTVKKALREIGNTK